MKTEWAEREASRACSVNTFYLFAFVAEPLRAETPVGGFSSVTVSSGSVQRWVRQSLVRLCWAGVGQPLPPPTESVEATAPSVGARVCIQMKELGIFQVAPRGLANTSAQSLVLPPYPREVA